MFLLKIFQGGYALINNSSFKNKSLNTIICSLFLTPFFPILKFRHNYYNDGSFILHKSKIYIQVCYKPQKTLDF